MDKPESNIRIVNFSNYVQPKVEERVSRKYVTYGEKNQYFQYLIDRSRGSATNGSVVQTIISLIFGEGLNEEDFYDTIPENDIQKIVNDFYRMGQCSIQVQTFGNGKKAKGTHIPVETLAAEKADKDGKINAYYYAKDWEKVRSINDTTRIPAFDGKTKGLTILYIKPYSSGLFYYSTPTFNGGLQYAELEEEIGNYHVNNIQNGLAPSMLINMNNGVPETEEKAKQIERRIQEKYSGSSNAGRAVLMFNDNKDSESTITPIPLSDASEQYQFLSDECMRKILVAHRVTSPLLMGISTNTGFGSNADELKVASVLFETMVIQPLRQILVQGFEQLDKFNGVTRDLDFVSLNPFMEDEEVNENVDEVIVEEEQTPDEEVQLSKGCNCETKLTKITEDDLKMFEVLETLSELEPEGYELHTVEHNIRDFDEERGELDLAATANSEQDSDLWKIRYAYNIGTSKQPVGSSRAFCNKMMSLAQSGRVFRKEDIDKMSSDGVNGQFAHSGGKYDIFLYGGGVNCYHRWERRIYKKKRDKDGKPLGGNAMQNTFPVSVSEARRQGAKIPKNNPDVAIAEINKPNNGAYPS
jgi:hypothetical protein